MGWTKRFIFFPFTLFMMKNVKIMMHSTNMIMLSEENYNSLLESLYLAGIPGMYESIIEGVNTPLDECEKIEWK